METLKEYNLESEDVVNSICKEVMYKDGKQLCEKLYLLQELINEQLVKENREDEVAYNIFKQENK